MRVRSVLKALAVVLGLAVVFNVLTMHRPLSLGQGGEGEGVVQQAPGDVNCDGALNISDAVHLLRYLFSDGGPPCAVAQEPDPCACPELLAAIDELNASLRTLKPHPRDMLNIASTIDVPSESTTAILDVPEARWFILTDLVWELGNTAEIIELEGEEFTTKIRYTDVVPSGVTSIRSLQSQPGIAFRPGSRIAVRNPQIGNIRGGFRLSGYFVDD